MLGYYRGIHTSIHASTPDAGDFPQRRIAKGSAHVAGGAIDSPVPLPAISPAAEALPKGRLTMHYSIGIAAVCSALALTACDRPTVVVPASTTSVVAVPGPAGPQGAPGAPAEKGATGATGATGSTGAEGVQGAQGNKGDRGKTGTETVVIVPVPAPGR